jgi:hypothetical protein
MDVLWGRRVGLGVGVWRGDAFESGGGGLARARSKPKFYTSLVSHRC